MALGDKLGSQGYAISSPPSFSGAKGTVKIKRWVDATCTAEVFQDTQGVQGFQCTND